MRLGVVDAVLPPFTRAKLKFLLRYILKPTDLRWLQEQSKKLHAQQQSDGAPRRHADQSQVGASAALAQANR